MYVHSNSMYVRVGVYVVYVGVSVYVGVGVYKLLYILSLRNIRTCCVLMG